ncbi:MAG: thiamine phosphate synthase [Thermoanaerobaculia bacterium]
MPIGLEVPALYVLADAGALGAVGLSEGVRRIVEAGVRWVQVRAKGMPDERLYEELLACAALRNEQPYLLWVNDRPDLARLVRADGVHVGQDDLAPAVVRGIVGPETVIGRSTHDLRQVEEAAADPEVDAVAFGPVYPTASKARPDPVVGLESLRHARARTDKPLVAIGGIDVERVRDVLAAGADSAAVLSAACRGDVAANCRRLLAAVGEEQRRP